MNRYERELRRELEQVAKDEGVELASFDRGTKHFRITFKVGDRTVTSTAAYTPGIIEHGLNFARQQARRAIRGAK